MLDVIHRPADLLRQPHGQAAGQSGSDDGSVDHLGGQTGGFGCDGCLVSFCYSWILVNYIYPWDSQEKSEESNGLKSREWGAHSLKLMSRPGGVPAVRPLIHGRCGELPCPAASTIVPCPSCPVVWSSRTTTGGGGQVTLCVHSSRQSTSIFEEKRPDYTTPLLHRHPGCPFLGVFLWISPPTCWCGIARGYVQLSVVPFKPLDEKTSGLNEWFRSNVGFYIKCLFDITKPFKRCIAVFIMFAKYRTIYKHNKFEKKSAHAFRNST